MDLILECTATIFFSKAKKENDSGYEGINLNINGNQLLTTWFLSIKN